MLIKKLGRPIDKLWRSYRTLILPSFRSSYRKIRERAIAIPGNQPVVVFDFQNNRIDGPQGRRFFNLAIMSIKAGYHPVFIDRRRFLSVKRENFKSYIFGLPYSILSPRSLEALTHSKGVFLTDQQDSPTWQLKSQFLGYFVSLKTGPILSDSELAWPFPMYPGLYQLDQDDQVVSLRNNNRKWSFFFGGRSSEGSYDKGWVRHLYGKLPRNTYLKVAVDQLHSLQTSIETPHGDVSHDNLLKRPTAETLLVLNEQSKLPLTDWLPTMASAKFFFACPGVRYPMSHNTVEALATGTVPIIEYPEHFTPPLTNGTNCLSFTGADGLRQAIIKGRNMSHEQWKTLSEGAARYYDEHLSPQAALQHLLILPQKQRPRLRLVHYIKEDAGGA